MVVIFIIQSSGNREADYSITSVQRALNILKLFIPQNIALSLMEICAQTGLNKSTALRMVYTLKEEGFLSILEETKKYKLGPAALQVGLSALDSVSVSKVADPILRKIVDETGLVAHLGILEGNNVVVIAKIFSLNKSASYVRLASRVGGILPIYCTGIGLLFLSQEKDEFVRGFLQNFNMVTYTSTTETNVEKIMERIKTIRKDKYCLNNGEHDEGILSICCPVYDYTNRMVAGISLGGVKELFNRIGIDYIKDITQRAAEKISNELGYYA